FRNSVLICSPASSQARLRKPRFLKSRLLEHDRVGRGPLRRIGREVREVDGQLGLSKQPHLGNTLDLRRYRNAVIDYVLAYERDLLQKDRRPLDQRAGLLYPKVSFRIDPNLALEHPDDLLLRCDFENMDLAAVHLVAAFVLKFVVFRGDRTRWRLFLLRLDFVGALPGEY